MTDADLLAGPPAFASAPSDDPLLLVVDLANLVTRCWHVGAPELGLLADGRGTHGVHGTVLALLKLLRRHTPDHVLIAADTPSALGVRRELDPLYKAHRPPADPDLVRQIGLAGEVLAAAGWPVVTAPRLEADDVIASAARSYPGRVLVLSGDRDLLALCSERVRVLLARPQGMHLLCGPAECHAVLGVLPERVTELKALAGDSSDGIVGVPGIGDKGAADLLRRRGSLDRIYADLLSVLPVRYRRLLATHRARCRLSFELARLRDDLDLGAPWVASEQVWGTLAADAVRGLGLHRTAGALAAA